MSDGVNKYKYHEVIFIGDCTHKSRRSYARLEALKKILPKAKFIEINWSPKNLALRWLIAFYTKYRFSILAPWHLIIYSILKSDTLVWVDNFPIFSKTSIKLFKYFDPGSTILFVSEDNFLLPHNFSKLHKPVLQYYDFIFTTKAFIIDKLSYMHNIYKFHDSFDDRFINFNSQRKVEKYGPQKYNVTFIGTYEEDRFNQLSYLAQNNIQVDIFGADWPKNAHQNLKIHSPVFGDDYQKVITSTKINLIFLRSSNFDTVTSRSYEIPFFNSFFLAQYSDDHSQLYQNPELLFDSAEDLLSKVNLWLARKPDYLNDVSREVFENLMMLDRSIFSETKQIIHKIKKG